MLFLSVFLTPSLPLFLSHSLRMCGDVAAWTNIDYEKESKSRFINSCARAHTRIDQKPVSSWVRKLFFLSCVCVFILVPFKVSCVRNIYFHSNGDEETKTRSHTDNYNTYYAPYFRNPKSCLRCLRIFHAVVPFATDATTNIASHRAFATHSHIHTLTRSLAHSHFFLLRNGKTESA